VAVKLRDSPHKIALAKLKSIPKKERAHRVADKIVDLIELALDMSF